MRDALVSVVTHVCYKAKGDEYGLARRSLALKVLVLADVFQLELLIRSNCVGRSRGCEDHTKLSVGRRVRRARMERRESAFDTTLAAGGASHNEKSACRPLSVEIYLPKRSKYLRGGSVDCGHIRLALPACDVFRGRKGMGELLQSGRVAWALRLVFFLVLSHLVEGSCGA